MAWKTDKFHKRFAESEIGTLRKSWNGRIKVAGQGSSWALPVVIGGRLYVRYDTNLYCYDIKAG